MARASLFIAVALVLVPPRALGKNPEEPETVPRAAEDLTFLDHEHPWPPWPIWLGAEVNSIFQYHPSFHAPRSGPNSLGPEAESAISGLFTIFLAYRPTRTTELILDPEMALGGGLSQALGVAGFPNLDVVRNPTLGHAPYIARAQIHQIIPLSNEWVPNEDRGPISSFVEVPKHRLELRFGKMSTADLFDINPAASDSHLQFMNWTVDNNGAWDYAADTRGYTYGLVIEYQGPRIEARLGEMLMPKVANGIDVDFNFTRARADNLELEIKYGLQARWRGTLRLLVYQNTANMGNYRQSIDAVAGMPGVAPNVTLTRAQGRVKRGVGANVIQEIAGVARACARLGWSTGDLESFAYTEVENTVLFGADILGVYWRRPTDRTGLAFVSNGISSDHADYLAAGGLGFLLGDGYLKYSRETIVEHYYNVHVWRGLSFAEDVQFIAHPGYNSDRGPVWVFSLRGHLEF
jgi:hypothetical protein